jgi:hypothetical protein
MLAYPTADPLFVESFRHVSTLLKHPAVNLPAYLTRSFAVTPVVDFPQSDRPTRWLSPKYDAIPSILREHDRWMFWTLDGDGRKVPRAVTKPDKNIDATKACNWSSYAKLIAASEKLNGSGFALGTVDKGPTFAGIDLDHCRNPITGVIEPWARDIIRTVDSYTEISPSGTGVKIFVTGTLPEDSTQGKVYQLEIYDQKRYFTVTGHHLPGTPTAVESRELQLRALYAQQRSQELIELTKLFGLHRQDRGEWIDITCPWAGEHTFTFDPKIISEASVKDWLDRALNTNIDVHRGELDIDTR